MAGPYDIGDEVTLEATFAVDGTLTDPSAVTCRVVEPDGALQTPAATRASAGVWRAVYSPTKSGDHWYRFEGTGAAKAAEEQMFNVRPRRA